MAQTVTQRLLLAHDSVAAEIVAAESLFNLRYRAMYKAVFSISGIRERSASRSKTTLLHVLVDFVLARALLLAQFCTTPEHESIGQRSVCPSVSGRSVSGLSVVVCLLKFVVCVLKFVVCACFVVCLLKFVVCACFSYVASFGITCCFGLLSCVFTFVCCC